MADFNTSLVPLNGKNYPTWKLQCRMALVKDSLWDILTRTETLAEGANADARKKFVARSDRALAIIVLAVDPSLYSHAGLVEPSLRSGYYNQPFGLLNRVETS